uniref:CTP synthase n=1 Tax=Noctiluca scintillans TaxID=2966 RepID=A0A7S1FH40_NOCSC
MAQAFAASLVEHPSQIVLTSAATVNMAGTGMKCDTPPGSVAFPSERGVMGVRSTPKYVVITGGTVSGLGKGTTISSIGVVLRSHGLRVTAIKIDPYLNVDAGTMSPFEHGEVYVLDDGGEADLDLGNYERFLDLTLTSDHSMTSGKIYEQVIKRERTGHYLGKTVQMVPHVTDAIQEWISDVSCRSVDGSGCSPDICLVELGGTVGDIESSVYLEALQQFQFKVGKDNFLMVHLGFLPVIGATGELKTKPCQHSVKLLREAGLKPDLLMCRSSHALDEATRKKLSLFCQVPPECVISLHDLSNLYRVPLLLAEQGVGRLISESLRLPVAERISPTLPLSSLSVPEEAKDRRLGDWEIIADRTDASAEEVVIAVVGKYMGNPDAYVSISKALKHAALEAGLSLVISWVESSDLEPNTEQRDPKCHEEAWHALTSANGVLVPGAFGNRGIEGKILTAKYCRESGTPFLGICVGLQVAVIEFARSVLCWDSANSTEFDEATPHPVVIFMPEGSTTIMGGTMRLGSRATIVRDTATLTCRLYGGSPVIYERHRHRYEVNPSCVPAMEARGLRFSGQDDRGQRMELCELEGHPFYVGCQFHPEFKSRPAKAGPLFLGLVLASKGRLESRIKQDGGCMRAGAGFERR